jgi:hypothetical protein
MPYKKHKTHIGAFVSCFALLLIFAPVVQEWLSSLRLMYSPYKHMLTFDVRLLACRLPGLIICLSLATLHWLINSSVCTHIVKHFDIYIIKLGFALLLSLLFAFTLPISLIIISQPITSIFNTFEMSTLCSRQSTYYFDIWIYMVVSYSISSIAVSGSGSGLPRTTNNIRTVNRVKNK